VSEEKIQIKGISEGLLVTLRGDRWKDAQELIISKIDQKAEFFQGAKIVVDVGELSLKAADLGKLRDELSTRGISLWAVLSRSETTLNIAQMLGLSTNLGVHQNVQKQKKGSTVFEGDSAVWVEKTLRAGYKVETKCHVIVMGDVNPGAEIISAGNILVWGRLSGSVHAGADGDQGAKVMALNMVPTGLQIGDRVALISAKKRKSQPEVAYVFENEIIIDGWDTQKNHKGDL
jgi:septum site-determining protein MinC